MSTKTMKSDPAPALLHAHCPSSETDDDADANYDDEHDEDANTQR